MLKKLVFKVSPGNMFTKAHPNSLWQGTEEEVTACAAAKFRRFKKVLLYLQWMWLMLGRPRESGWLIHCYFQKRGDRGFSSLSGEIEKAACALWGAGNFNLLREGRALQPTIYKRTPVYSRGHNAEYVLFLHCMCVTGDSRGQTVNEWKPGSFRTHLILAEMQRSHCLSSGLSVDKI